MAQATQKGSAAGISVTPGVPRHVEMTGPESEMDLFGSDDEPANPLPARCGHCTMPELDYVARPYLLAKGFAAPTESSSAAVGNFLVVERVRKILELAVPGACTFHPTAEMKSKKPTAWSLAVPATVLEKPEVVAKGPRCSKCGEPKLGYWYGEKFWEDIKRHAWPMADVFKSKQWRAQATVEDNFEEANRYRAQDGEALLTWDEMGVEPPTHAERWTRRLVTRDVFFSMRMYQLLKKAKVKGQLVLSYSYKFVTPTEEDMAWADEKLQILAAEGLVEGGGGSAGKAGAAKGVKAAASAGKSQSVKGAGAKTKTKVPAAAGAGRWLKQYLAKNAPKKKPPRADFAAVEKKHKVSLPQAYKDFIAAVGARSFDDVMEVEGFKAKVLPPGKLGFRGYRRGKVKDLDEDSARIDGVQFADTDHGDVFVFDVSGHNGGDYPVYWYDHEQNSYEPFAPDFAACVRRFVERN
jgi:hypothetical protein